MTRYSVYSTTAPLQGFPKDVKGLYTWSSRAVAIFFCPFKVTSVKYETSIFITSMNIAKHIAVRVRFAKVLTPIKRREIG